MSSSSSLPKDFLDAHHHFLNTATNGETFSKFLGKLVPNSSYLDDDYFRDVIEPLQKAGVNVQGSIHMECLPDNGIEEAKWVSNIVQNSSTSSIQAIIASCNLAQEASIVEKELEALAQIDKVKGIRWIVDCVGKFNGKDATHVSTSRHDGIDYLRGSDGGYDGTALPAFETGFGLLKKFNLTFDLQCAPVQLEAAAALIARHPNTKVVIDHLGKPRTLLGPDTEENRANTTLDEAELASWRRGMNCIATNPNVYVKISMLGYAIPGWIRTKERIELMKYLVQETVEIFGPERCMVATNWYANAAASDSDGLSDVGPDILQFIELIYGFLKDEYSEEDLDRIFCTTAKEFYNL